MGIKLDALTELIYFVRLR